MVKPLVSYNPGLKDTYGLMALGGRETQKTEALLLLEVETLLIWFM